MVIRYDKIRVYNFFLFILYRKEYLQVIDFLPMNTQKITAIYRVKNEARFIEQSLKSVVDFCSEIIVLDDNSTDGTAEICSGFDKVSDIIKPRGDDLDEVRDRNYLFETARKNNPDFILSVDGVI